MDDLTALLAAVITNPEEDTPRLMYADAVESDSRREYIRVSVLETDKVLLFETNPPWAEFPEGITPQWSRGFVESITCDAPTFLRHADALIWHPTETVACGECGGDGWYDAPTNSTSAGSVIVCRTCPKKHDSIPYGCGRVPRPIPPTAQPIRRVVLTTTPLWEDVAAWFGAGAHGKTMTVMFAKKCPDIEFVPPTEQHVDVMSGGTGTVVNMVAGAPIRAGQLVASDAQGRAVPAGGGVTPRYAAGVAVRDSQ